MDIWAENQIMVVLQEQGLLAKKHRRVGNEIMICCPFHADKTPSMSISLDKGIVHCFAGDFDGTFTQFIYKLLGSYDRDAVEYVKRFQGGIEFKINPLPTKSYIQDIKIPQWDDLNIPEEQLAKFDFTDWQYSTGRGISKEACKRFRLGFDYERGAVTFPMFVGGKCIGIATRKIDKKKFYIPKELADRKPLMYLDEAVKQARLNKKSKVVVTEGIYDSLSCYTHNIPSVASLGCPTQEQAQMLIESDIKEVLLACDGDNAGRLMENQWKGWLKDKKKVTSLNIPNGEDLNSLLKNEVEFKKIVVDKYWE